MSETSPGIAALSYPNRGLRIMACHWPTPSELPQFCSCGDIDCPTPARHPIGTLTIDQATANLGQLARWWQANPRRQRRHDVRRTSRGHRAAPSGTAGHPHASPQGPPCSQAPMIYADQGVVHLLVKPDPFLDQSAADIASHPTSSTDKVVITPPGTLVLLPPSRSMTRLRIHWMSHLHHVDRLPEAAHMLEVLTELRKDGVLDELDPRLFSSSPA